MSETRQSIDDYYLSILQVVAARSTCARRKVGAIITDDRSHVLSMGYNGVPSEVPHCTEQPCPGVEDQPGDNSRCQAVHAEQNAIMQCSSLRHARTIYVSCAPCFYCAKMICNTGIARVVCAEQYADDRGLSLLNFCGIEVIVCN